MKKVYIINICALIIIFLTAGIITEPENYREQAETAMSKRIDILNDYYGCKVDYEKSAEKLNQAEKGHLLEKDLKLMEEFSATDMDMVEDYHIEITSVSESNYGVIKGQAEIRWLLMTYSGRVKETYNYYFTVETDETGSKLTEFKKL